MPVNKEIISIFPSINKQWDSLFFVIVMNVQWMYIGIHFVDFWLLFSVPAQVSVFAIGSEVLIEGGSVSLHCIASAYPEPTVTWAKLNSDGFTELSDWLNFTSIGRDKAGNYICIANNTCGKRNSSTTTIDVQCKGAETDIVYKV